MMLHLTSAKCLLLDLSPLSPPKGHPNLEAFLSKFEKDLFSCTDNKLGYSNLSSEDWKAMRSLA